MAKYDGTRFTKAATPQAGAALNLTNRVVGSNPRKQKLTEASGTNPMKFGGTSIKGAPRASSGAVASNSGYAQDTAPHKTLSNDYPFSVGGPGFPKPMK